MLRYLKQLEDRDIALNRGMIPLGSCTMKLNATAEMLPITWPGFADIHPFAPAGQTPGYATLIADLRAGLPRPPAFAASACSPMPAARANMPACWRYAPTMQRAARRNADICLIPSSAHGTNPASAAMAGLRIVVVGCDREGNIDVADLRAKASNMPTSLAALMITYPSTHGVFEGASARSATSCTRKAARCTWTAPT